MHIFCKFQWFIHIFTKKKRETKNQKNKSNRSQWMNKLKAPYLCHNNVDYRVYHIVNNQRTMANHHYLVNWRNEWKLMAKVTVPNGTISRALAIDVDISLGNNNHRRNIQCWYRGTLQWNVLLLHVLEKRITNSQCMLHERPSGNRQWIALLYLFVSCTAMIIVCFHKNNTATREPIKMTTTKKKHPNNNATWKLVRKINQK